MTEPFKIAVLSVMLCLALSLDRSWAQSFEIRRSSPVPEDCSKITDSVRRLRCLVRDDERKNPPKPTKEWDPNNSTDDEKRGFSEAARSAGFNCPRIDSIEKTGEDAIGWIVRITCASVDTNSKWDIRMTGYPLSPPRFEPW